MIMFYLFAVFVAIQLVQPVTTRVEGRQLVFPADREKKLFSLEFDVEEQPYL